jgi:flagellar biosynthetic protein FlhB
MAQDGPGGEKTEKPTPQRLKKARKEGQIPRTQELGTWLGVAAASVLLPMLVGNAFEAVQKLFLQIGSVASNPEPAALSAMMGQALSTFLSTLLPMALGMMVVGTVAAAAQGGVTFATKAMKPTLKKLNPFPGIKRMFGTQGLWESAKALIKTAALATVVIVTSDRAQALVSSAGALPLSAVAATFTDSAILMFRVVAVTGLVIAVADYVVVRMKTMKKLKMSKYEITQEHKQSEGDPHMGSRCRCRGTG